MPVLVEELTRLEGHKWQISCLEFNQDGSRLATGSWDKEVRVWNLGSLDTAVTLKGLHEVPVTSLAWFKLEGSLIASAYPRMSGHVGIAIIKCTGAYGKSSLRSFSSY